MKFGVVIFPGSNCDHDLIDVLETLSGASVEKLWHRDTDLKSCTHIFIPGGFSYGDYLRSGAIAHLAPIMTSVSDHASKGGFVMGICNGFQILCESGLLPGALARNTNIKFTCKNVNLTPGSSNTTVTQNIPFGSVLSIPIAHGEGRFICDDATLQSIEENDQVIFRYCNEAGDIVDEANPNGSLNNIAGICNASKNVFGMMPHPERCALPHLFNTDGRLIFDSILQHESASVVD
jgi:phosphoribosylformylglycinamidine synthase subunit PurQ / glutaminase